MITYNTQACQFYEKQGWEKLSTHEEDATEPYHLYKYSEHNRKKMENKSVEQNSADWLTFVKEKTAAKQSGQFSSKDKFGLPVILEWKKTDITSPELVEFKKCICEIASQTLAPIEMEFLRRYPESVNQELFLKACAPFFENGPEAVNWEMVKERIQSTIKQFYLTDLSSFGADIIKPLLDDIYFLVTVKNSETEKPLGFTMFAITPALPFGNIKVINIAIAPAEQNRELDKLLMSSIFKIVPNVERLFIFSRPTNDHAIKTYSSWGFAEDKHVVQDPNHKVNMEYTRLFEYKTERNEALQKTAKTLGL